MAQRYGGAHSPDPQSNDDVPTSNAWHRQTRSRAGGRVNLLFLLPLPLGLRAFFLGSSGALVVTLSGLGMLLLGAWLTREGLIAQEAFDARKVARRPAMPRKILGAVATGLGLALAVVATGSVATALLLGALGTILHLFAFGLDPMKSKGMEGIDTFQQDRVARAVDEAEKHLAAMSDAIARSGDRAVEARVERFQATAREMFRTVEEDPRDLSASRRFLGVYLLGAKDAAVKYADISARGDDTVAKGKFMTLLDDLEATFSAKARKLLLDDQADLDIEIEVLTDRLNAENRLHDRSE